MKVFLQNTRKGGRYKKFSLHVEKSDDITIETFWIGNSSCFVSRSVLSKLVINGEKRKGKTSAEEIRAWYKKGFSPLSSARGAQSPVTLIPDDQLRADHRVMSPPVVHIAGRYVKKDDVAVCRGPFGPLFVSTRYSDLLSMLGVYQEYPDGPLFVFRGTQPDIGELVAVMGHLNFGGRYRDAQKVLNITQLLDSLILEMYTIK